MDPLTRRWRADCTAAAASAHTSVVDAVGVDLIARWREPHRHYHDARHLSEVLSAVDVLCPQDPLRPTGSRAVALLAGWFHDAVYDPAPGSENERASAELARTTLGGLGVGAALVDRVVTVIVDTIDHDVLEDAADEARVVFHDADLWILGAPVSRFDEYCRQVRAEFAHVAPADFAAARTAVLRPFLVRPHVYLTDHARRLWEPAARENLARELTRLAG
jgi:predicted metal-dependent HD superfamily phosphohydrolase